MTRLVQQRFFEFGEFRLDVSRRLLLRDGEPIALTPKAFDILLVLLENQGRVVGKDELMRLVWLDTAVEENNLTRNISSLRKALAEGPHDHRYILTIPGRGYQFAPELPEEASRPAPHDEANTRGVVQGRVAVENLPVSASGPRPGWLRFSARVALAAGLLLVLLASGWRFASRKSDAALPPPRVVPITALPDQAFCSALSPDGKYVAFSRRGESPELSGIYIKRIGNDEILRLTHDQGDLCPAWSPDGHSLAFSRYHEREHAIYLIGALGGSERKLYSGPTSWPLLDWAPDGKAIAFSTAPPGHSSSSIALLTLETLAVGKLTKASVGEQDWAPVFSPDGKSLAFVRANGNHTKAELFLASANGGEPRRLTFDDASIASSPAWTRDGKSLLFSSSRAGLVSIWRMPSNGGSPVQVLGLGVKAMQPRISSSGSNLTYEQHVGNSSLWILSLARKGKDDARAQVTATRGGNQAAELSPDKARMAFVSNRSGNDEIYVCNADGSNLLQLTALGTSRTPGRPHWSPDGREIVFDSVLNGHNGIFVLEANGGPPRLLTDNRGFDDLNPSWSHDGKSIYFTSNRTGEWQIWRLALQGGQVARLTQGGGFAAFESADARSVYFAKTADGPEIWRIDLETRQENAVSPTLHVDQWTGWSLTNTGIYFVKEAPNNHPVLRFFDVRTGRAREVTKLQKQPWPLWISATADGQFVVYGQLDVSLSNIMLVENFK